MLWALDVGLGVNECYVEMRMYQFHQAELVAKHRRFGCDLGLCSPRRKKSVRAHQPIKAFQADPGNLTIGLEFDLIGDSILISDADIGAAFQK